MKKLILFLFCALAFDTQAQIIDYDGSNILVTATNQGDTAALITLQNFPFPNGELPNGYAAGRIYTLSDTAGKCAFTGLNCSHTHPANPPGECGTASFCCDRWLCPFQSSNYLAPSAFISFTIPYNRYLDGCAMVTDGQTHNYYVFLSVYKGSGTSWTIYRTIQYFTFTTPALPFVPCGSGGGIVPPNTTTTRKKNTH